MEMPANLLGPEQFAEQASAVLDGLDASVRTTIRDADWCRRHQMNGLLSVGAGSERKVCFLEVVYEVSWLVGPVPLVQSYLFHGDEKNVDSNK